MGTGLPKRECWTTNCWGGGGDPGLLGVLGPLCRDGSGAFLDGGAPLEVFLIKGCGAAGAGALWYGRTVFEAEFVNTFLTC